MGRAHELKSGAEGPFLPKDLPPGCLGRLRPAAAGTGHLPITKSPLRSPAQEGSSVWEPMPLTHARGTNQTRVVQARQQCRGVATLRRSPRGAGRAPRGAAASSTPTWRARVPPVQRPCPGSQCSQMRTSTVTRGSVHPLSQAISPVKAERRGRARGLRDLHGGTGRGHQNSAAGSARQRCGVTGGPRAGRR